jgi:hypothetical protein
MYEVGKCLSYVGLIARYRELTCVRGLGVETEGLWMVLEVEWELGVGVCG